MRTALALVGLVVLQGCGRSSSPAATTTTTEQTSSTPGSAPAAGELGVGSPAPAFSATAHDGTVIDPSALRGKHVVLYFYPKDETPGCTKQACAFRDAWQDFESAGVVLVGISSDSLDSHKSFASRHRLPFHLVSDPGGAIANAYGVPTRLGFFARQTFVIGPDGNLKKIYRSVDVTRHAAEVLADVQS